MPPLYSPRCRAPGRSRRAAWCCRGGHACCTSPPRASRSPSGQPGPWLFCDWKTWACWPSLVAASQAQVECGVTRLSWGRLLSHRAVSCSILTSTLLCSLFPFSAEPSVECPGHMSRGRTGVTVCSARRAARYCRAAAGCAAGGAAAAAWLAQAAGYLGPATCRGCTTGHPSTAQQPRQVEAGAEAGGRSNDRYTPPPPVARSRSPAPPRSAS